MWEWPYKDNVAAALLSARGNSATHKRHDHAELHQLLVV
jgi:hypothetical protein